MNISELMIGDLVTFGECQNETPPVVVEIVGIEPDVVFVYIDRDKRACEEIDPADLVGMPITFEILAKNGFKETNVHTFQKRTATAYITWVRGWLGIAKGCAPITTVRVSCKYVHQLQHALKLCGIKKDIKL